MKDIYILGSLNMDLAIYASRYPEAGETLRGSSFRTGAGGKGLNQAVAAAKLGAKVHFLGAIGHDSFGREMKDVLLSNRVDASFVHEKEGISSGVALIEVCNAENRIILDLGANEQITTSDVDAFLSKAQSGDIFLTQGENDFEAIKYALALAHRQGLKTILNPAPADKAMLTCLADVDVLCPNETEFAFLSEGDDSSLLKLPLLVVTLGKKGSLYFESGKSHEVPAVEVAAVDSTGAGDAHCGALAFALAGGYSSAEAVRLASLYASLKVTRKGTSVAMPTKEELLAFIRSLKK
jgi:ribokinase